jgi:gliding-associated putative ABC transporter substrate-binding component GldG
MVNKKINKVQKSVFIILGLLMILIAINWLANFYFYRIDLTSEKRYTLSPSTKKILTDLDDYVYVKCYLKGEFPSGFMKLQQSTKEMLEEFNNVAGKKFRYEFIDVKEGRNEQQQKDFRKQLEEKGINPIQLNVQSEDNFKEQIAYPWCLVTYKNKEVPVFILNNQMGKSASEQLNNSIALLEYNLVVAIDKVKQETKKGIAVSSGNGEMPVTNMIDFLNTIAKDYNAAPVDINTIVRLPNEKIDALIIVKPTKEFTEKEKFKIDQFVMNGGKVMWILDMLDGDIDSLRRRNEYMAPDYNLNLEDQLFTYGVRVNKAFVQDYSCAPLPMVNGYVNNQPQFKMYPWLYFPVLMSTSNHPISKNLDAILTMFPSCIDTVGNSSIKKTVLLQSSKYSRVVYSPASVDIRMMKMQPQPTYFNKPNQIISVLLEGEFASPYAGRISPGMANMLDSLHITFKPKSAANKMIVIADGDMVKNPAPKGEYQFSCGYYPFTKQTFANKDFLLNCIKYLTDESGVIDARAKEIKLRMLDAPKVKDEKTKWQVINILLPLILVVLIGITFNYVREKKFS